VWTSPSCYKEKIQGRNWRRERIKETYREDTEDVKKEDGEWI
jgi:hypothetical protein